VTAPKLEEKRDFGRTLLIVAALAIIIVPLARFVGRQAAEAENTRESRGAPVNLHSDNVRTMVSSQTSDGLTPDDMTQDWLNQIAEYSRQRVVANATRSWDESAVPEADREVTAEPVFVEVSGKKLGVVRFRMAGGMASTAMIIGLQGASLVRVICADESLGDVVVTAGPCAQAVNDAFDVDFGIAS
jgi:hypothetical protein